jgi:hypothetical protein
MGINPNNKITIIIRMLFAVTLFQQHILVALEVWVRIPILVEE